MPPIENVVDRGFQSFFYTPSEYNDASTQRCHSQYSLFRLTGRFL
jgi:hypothetical protein